MTRARTIAATVRSHRKRLGLSQLELAQRIGCTEATVQSIEAGRVASPRQPERIADALAISLDELFGRKKKSDVS